MTKRGSNTGVPFLNPSIIPCFRHSSALLAPLVAVGSLLAAAPAKIPVLIVDGQNNHQWVITTPMLKRILEQTGRFTVDVSTSPAAKPAAPRLAKDATPAQKAAHEEALKKLAKDEAA
jgi:hypothetical protein